jgi:hypothetical protein
MSGKIVPEELSGCLSASEDFFEKLVMRIGDLVHKPTLSHPFGGSSAKPGEEKRKGSS